MHPTLPLLARTDFARLRRQRLDTLQVNLGCRCNQRCLIGLPARVDGSARAHLRDLR